MPLIKPLSETRAVSDQDRVALNSMKYGSADSAGEGGGGGAGSRPQGGCSAVSGFYVCFEGGGWQPGSMGHLGWWRFRGTAGGTGCTAVRTLAACTPGTWELEAHAMAPIVLQPPAIVLPERDSPPPPLQACTRSSPGAPRTSPGSSWTPAWTSWRRRCRPGPSARGPGRPSTLTPHRWAGSRGRGEEVPCP